MSSKKAYIFSSYEMDKIEIEAVRARFDFLSDAELTQRIDPKIIGGFVVRFENKVYDYTVNHLLQNFKTKLI